MKKLDFVMDLTDALSSLVENVQEDAKSFEDILNLDNSLDRHLYIADIESGIGSTIDSMIRFWNRRDEEEGLNIEERKPIKIYIDSCGGSLTDAFTIIDSIRMSKTPVITIATGCAYSAGFFIFISGHKRIAYPHASFLYHEGSATNGGTAGQFRNFADFYDIQLTQLKQIVLDYTDIDEDEYNKHKKDDWWMTAEDAINYGMADKIAEEFI